MEAQENMLKGVRESGDHYQMTIRMRSRLFNSPMEDKTIIIVPSDF